MNPEVLVVHKPLAHFDSQQANLVAEVLREFVDQRGVGQPFEELHMRRPRTCILPVR